MKSIDIILMATISASVSFLIYFAYKFMKGHLKEDNSYSSNCQILDNMEVDLENVFEYDVGINGLRQVGDIAEFIVSKPTRSKKVNKSKQMEVEIK